MRLRGLEAEWQEIEDAEFKLKPLTAAERMECLSYGDINTANIMFDKAVRYALVDWKNVEDTDGNPVAFDKSLIDGLPDNYWSAIARHVLKFNSLGAEDEKN